MCGFVFYKQLDYEKLVSHPAVTATLTTSVRGNVRRGSVTAPAGRVEIIADRRQIEGGEGGVSSICRVV